MSKKQKYWIVCDDKGVVTTQRYLIIFFSRADAEKSLKDFKENYPNSLKKYYANLKVRQVFVSTR